MKLELDTPRRPFRPGDTITGHIYLAADDVDVSKTHLILESRAKTKTVEKSSDTKNVYRARAPLLYQLHELELNVHAVPVGQNCRLVPFALPIPLDVQKVTNIPTTKDGIFKSYWTYDWGKQKDNFQHEAGHPLPPTFRAGPRGVLTKSECYVEYCITAVGSRDVPSIDDGASEQLEPFRFDTRPFWLQSACSMTEEDFELLKRTKRKIAQRMTVQTMRLLPEISAREKGKLTFKEKWKNAFSSSRLPEVTFHMALKVPTYLHVGEKMRLVLIMERVDPTTASNGKGKKSRPRVQFPDIQIDKVEIKMKHITQVRTRGMMKMHTDHWTEAAWTDVQAHGLLHMTLPMWEGEQASPVHSPIASDLKHLTTVVEASAKEQSLVSGQSLDAMSRTFHLPSSSTAPSRLIPTFSTYNISRSYELRITLAFSCAGEKLFMNYNAPITVYSKPTISTKTAPLPARRVQSMFSSVSEPAPIGASLIGDPHAFDLRDDISEPAVRVDSGLPSIRTSSEDWGEYKLTPDDRLASKEMAGFAVGALGTAAEIADILSNAL
ncbi:hypothetical protein AAFC00_000028 [Neodothiora populina]|uniref:Arrestin-like N-terminal domain-containing protein n=1 Tax=Neodothiora populina TaxID=2781224 RepID=A0ABR3P155_9PEZI